MGSDLWCIVVPGYLWILAWAVILVVAIRRQRKNLRDLDRHFARYRRTKAQKRRVFRE